MKKQRKKAKAKLPNGFIIKKAGNVESDDLIWFGASGRWLKVSQFLPNTFGVSIECFVAVATLRPLKI